MSDRDELLELDCRTSRKALIALLRQAIDYARFPLAPRLDPPKSVLAKLDPPKPQYEPPPPLRPGMGPAHGQGRRR